MKKLIKELREKMQITQEIVRKNAMRGRVKQKKQYDRKARQKR